MIDAGEIRERVLKTLREAPFQGSAKLIELWQTDPEGYKWKEPLVIEIWEKVEGSFYARATRKELRELLSIGNTPIEALDGFLMRFKLEPKIWKKKGK